MNQGIGEPQEIHVNRKSLSSFQKKSKSHTFKKKRHTVDGWNPAPRGMYKTLLFYGINYQPQLVSRISAINSIMHGIHHQLCSSKKSIPNRPPLLWWWWRSCQINGWARTGRKQVSLSGGVGGWRSWKGGYPKLRACGKPLRKTPLGGTNASKIGKVLVKLPTMQ